MAVFTPVSHPQLSIWLSQWSEGSLEQLSPILSGIENTNYFADTSQGRFILTLFEKLTPAELPYYLGLMHHLARQGLPCPEPRRLSHGDFFAPLQGKPAALVSRLTGASCLAPTLTQCAHLGLMLAKLHQAGSSYALTQPNPRGKPWRESSAATVRHFLPPTQQARLDQALQATTDFDPQLPHGPIHGDLFRDNVLFDGENVSGLIDFYFAGEDNWIYDLAIVVNDWCLTPDAHIDHERAITLVSAYTGQRPVLIEEQQRWPHILLSAALRFWLSRLQDFHLPRASELLQPHDPQWFETLVTHHLTQPQPWPC